MLATGAKPAGQFVMDEYSVSYHGLAHTHMDALSHMAWEGKMYNGVAQNGCHEQGAPELAVTAYKDGIFTRGILMDIPRLKNLPYLEPGAAIYPEDLDAWEKKAGVKVGAGDVVFIRTGRWARRKEKGAWDPARSGGAVRVLREVAEAARRRDGGQRRRNGRDAFGRVRGDAADAPAAADRHGHADLRQLRFRGVGRRRGEAEPVGISDHGVAHPHARRHGLAAESDRRVLSRRGNMKKPLCFVLMPFGTKLDASGSPVQFDLVYKDVIAPAIAAAGMQPIRADEEMTGGIIHKPMFERLLLCEYAVADLTTSNANVFYELGVRHAVRPYTTVLIYAGSSRLPFDVAPCARCRIR